MPRNGIRVALSNYVTVRNNFCSGNFERGIFTGHAEHILIEHNECSYSQDEHGIYHSNSGDYPIIRYNRCHHNNGCGIHMNGDASMGGDGTISYAEVYGNTIYENGVGGGAGINCDGVNHSVIYNNLLYENHATGITLFRWDGAVPSTANRVFNNTVVNAANGRWCLSVTDGSVDNTVINNILINRHTFRGSIVIDAASLAGFSSTCNILTDRLSVDGDETIIASSEFEKLGYGTGNMAATAMENLFIDWQKADFHLAAGCPAVDAGSATVADVVKESLDGVSRPQNAKFDVGAYEQRATSVTRDVINRDSPRMVSAPQFVNGTVVFTGLQAGDQLVVLTPAGRIIHRQEAVGERVVFTSSSLASETAVYAIMAPDDSVKSRGTMVLRK
jgi:parallel beta-helix repeat protein